MTVKTIYCDGGVVLNNPSTVGGTWAVVGAAENGVDAAWIYSGFLVAGDRGVGDDGPIPDEVTNNFTELFAIVAALEAAGPGWNGTIRSDSLVSIRRARDPKDAKMSGIPEWLHKRLVEATARAGHVVYELLSGHPTRKELESGIGKRGYPCHRLNVLCDDLCKEQAARLLSDPRSNADEEP